MVILRYLLQKNNGNKMIYYAIQNIIERIFICKIFIYISRTCVTIQHMKNNTEKFLVSVAPLTRIALTRDQSFFYTFSRSLPDGTLVDISMGRRIVTGVVTACSKDFPRESTFQLKKITRVIEESFLTKEQLALAFFISTYYLSPLGIVLKHFVPKKVTARSHTIIQKKHAHTISTTPEQEHIIKKIYNTQGHKKIFLHVTDQADKMSIIFSLIKKIKSTNNTQTLYLMPELIQTPYFTDFFHRFFDPTEVAIIHSKIPKGELYRTWCAIRSGQIKLIIGTRSALFAPFQKLGAIIVDEAHDMTHKQWEHNPLYDVRTASVELAHLHNCLHLSTSATPRVVDYFAKNHQSDVQFLTCISKKMPPIEIVDMKKERWDKNKSSLSRALVTQIKYTLKNNKQVLLFVNRQGTSAFSVCTKCRTVPTCPTCERALITISKKTYLCLHCNTQSPVSPKCAKCNSPIEHIGIGTGRIRAEISKIFPHARIAIADASTMSINGAHKKIYDDFTAHKIDIVIGTQMITKSWHTESVGLCAVIDLENIISIPDYTTNERAFAFIIQMALRTHKGKLIVQTFHPENHVVCSAQKYDFDGFYDEELDLRQALHYPPYATLIKLTYQDIVKKTVEQKMAEIYKNLITLTSTNKNIRISEPHFPIIDKVRTKYRQQIIIKIIDQKITPELRGFLTAAEIKLTVDIDPVQIS